MPRLFWAACRPSRRFPSRFLRPSHAGGVPMDASRLVAAFALAQGPGCDKSGGRPVAAGLGVGLLKHTHPLMPPPPRSVGLGNTSTDHVRLWTDKFGLELHFRRCFGRLRTNMVRSLCNLLQMASTCRLTAVQSCCAARCHGVHAAGHLLSFSSCASGHGR